MSRIILAVKDLEIALDPSGVEIDHEVSFELVEGEVLGLVGESASGKTTAATSLLNFQRRGAKIAAGSITIDDRDVLALGSTQLRQLRGGVISYVPQDPGSALNPALRIGTFHPFLVDNEREVYVFERSHDGNTCIVALNRSQHHHTVHLPVSMTATNLLTGHEFRGDNLTVPARKAVILRVDE